MEPAKIVSREEWLAARTALLAKEKEFTHRRDQLSAERRALPWVKVEKEYVFDTPNGRKHDVTVVVVSRAPLAEIEAYRKRMGWGFTWVSSYGSDFNYDYHVSFTAEEMAKGKVYYNYRMTDSGIDELPGLSVFYKDEAGNVFHTYSSYARGAEDLITTYMVLDLTPKGRNETGPHHNLMDWVRRHDEYDKAGDSRSCCAEQDSRR